VKKVLKGILIVLLLIAAIVGFICGKEYIENKKIENIVKSDEAKDYNKVKKNPMGGIYILLIINDDPEMIFDTTLEKNTVGGKYTTGAGGFSPKLYKLTNELEE